MISDFHNDLLTEGAMTADRLGEQISSGVCAVFRGGKKFAVVAGLAGRVWGGHP